MSRLPSSAHAVARSTPIVLLAARLDRARLSRLRNFSRAIGRSLEHLLVSEPPPSCSTETRTAWRRLVGVSRGETGAEAPDPGLLRQAGQSLHAFSIPRRFADVEVERLMGLLGTEEGRDFVVSTVEDSGRVLTTEQLTGRALNVARTLVDSAERDGLVRLSREAATAVRLLEDLRSRLDHDLADLEATRSARVFFLDHPGSMAPTSEGDLVVGLSVPG